MHIIVSQDETESKIGGEEVMVLEDGASSRDAS